MANYRLKNLKTGHLYERTYTDFAAAVDMAKAVAKSFPFHNPTAVMGQPFFDETDHGTEFTSQLYVAHPPKEIS